MADSKKKLRELEIMLADKKAAKEMLAAMSSDGTLSKRTERALAVALASNDLAADVKAQIDASTGAVSEQNEKVLDIAMSSEKLGDELEADIES
jgi:hypothetical protein